MYVLETTALYSTSYAAFNIARELYIRTSGTNILEKPKLRAVRYEYSEDFKLYPMTALKTMIFIHSRVLNKSERVQHC